MQIKKRVFLWQTVFIVISLGCAETNPATPEATARSSSGGFNSGATQLKPVQLQSPPRESQLKPDTATPLLEVKPGSDGCYTHLEQLLAKGGVVELPPGSCWQLQRETKVLSNTILRTKLAPGEMRSANPALIRLAKKATSTVYGLTIQGSHILLEDFIFDFYTGDEWRNFLAGISFTHPTYRNPEPITEMEDVVIRGVKFVDSAFPSGARSTKDNWAIVLNAPNVHQADPSSKPIPIIPRDILIEGNYMMRRHTQLISGGGQGINGLAIVGNRVEYGEMNAIATSSLRSEAVFRNVTIKNNVILNATHLGIFAGQDGSATGKKISLANYCILENMIDLAPTGPDYPSGIFLRVSGQSADVLVQGNMIHTAEPHKNQRHPRYYTFHLNDGEMVERDNHFIGGGSKVKRGNGQLLNDTEREFDCYRHRCQELALGEQCQKYR